MSGFSQEPSFVGFPTSMNKFFKTVLSFVFDLVTRITHKYFENSRQPVLGTKGQERVGYSQIPVPGYHDFGMCSLTAKAGWNMWAAERLPVLLASRAGSQGRWDEGKRGRGEVALLVLLGGTTGLMLAQAFGAKCRDSAS